MLNKIIRTTILTAATSATLLLVSFLNASSTSFPTITYNQTPEMGDQVVVYFPSPISGQKARSVFHIVPEVPGELQWLPDYRELHFVPLEGFDPDRTYTITVSKTTFMLASLLPHSGEAVKQIQATAFPKRRKLVRLANDSTIYYITESGLKRPVPNTDVLFSYPGNRLEDVEIINEQDLGSYPDNTLIRLLNDHRVYKLKNRKKRWIKSPVVFQKLGLDWRTIAPVNSIEFASYPEGDPIEFIKSIPSQVAVSEGKFIEFDLKAMRVRLFEDGAVVKEYPIAGKGNPRRSPTRKGLFSIKTKEEKHFSGISRVWMPWSMQYSGNYYIHGWPYWPGGKPIKSKYSLGCIRLYLDNAQEIFSWSEVGIPVFIH